jgi:hypothetical protein
VDNRQKDPFALDTLFFSGFQDDADKEYQGRRTDLNGREIRRDDYDKPDSEFGWTLCALRRPSGEPSEQLVPIHIRAFDALPQEDSAPRAVPDAELDVVFQRSFKISEQLNGSGIRMDPRQQLICRGDYGKASARFGWTLCALRRPSGEPSEQLVPIHIRAFDALPVFAASPSDRCCAGHALSELPASRLGKSLLACEVFS